jgi:hypothetical protein
LAWNSWSSFLSLPSTGIIEIYNYTWQWPTIRTGFHFFICFVKSMGVGRVSPRTLEAEAGGWWVPGQPGLQSKIMLQTNKNPMLSLCCPDLPIIPGLKPSSFLCFLSPWDYRCLSLHPSTEPFYYMN